MKNANTFDYKSFRLSKLNTPEFRHIYLLLFWPIFGLLFTLVERGIFPRDYSVVECELDFMIPFNEFFLIPYLFWFIFLVAANVYTFFFDVDIFKKMLKYFIFTYGITIIIYFLFPTAQELRPAEFARDNFLTRFMRAFYEFDTNTNVCPSLHVIGSIAAMLGFWFTKPFNTPVWRTVLVVIVVLICLSTVFLKQHSVLDIPPALLICAIAYPFTFGNVRLGKKKHAVSYFKQLEGETK